MLWETLQQFMVEQCHIVLLSVGDVSVDLLIYSFSGGSHSEQLIIFFLQFFSVL